MSDSYSSTTFSSSELDPRGLGGEDPKQWPKVTPRAAAVPAIDRLMPGSPLHERVKEYLMKKLKGSETFMTEFYSRWRAAEIRHQAYINLPAFEKAQKDLTNRGEPPEITSIVVPYNFATISVIVTYLVNVFTGRKPMFTLGTYNKELVKSAQYQEQLLQQNADHTRLVRHMYQFLLDGQVYGVGIMRNLWKIEFSQRTVRRTPDVLMPDMPIMDKERKVTFEGTDVVCVDPFMFFPDPRVPMVDVARKGEFVFWRSFEGRHTLLNAEKDGTLKWVRFVGSPPRDMQSQSARNLGAGRNISQYSKDGTLTGNWDQVDQGSVTIIPRELGLGLSPYPEKWLFTVVNKKQIVQAVKLDYDHDMHPITVNEPYTNGYGFGHNGLSDYLAPIQDALSWLINSHIYNVRAALNNMIVFDPSRIEEQDLKNPKPGKLIRAKQAAAGQDIRTMLQQLQVADVTKSHFQDFQLFMAMGDTLSAVTDAMKGRGEEGGRKTAVEVRTKLEAAVSRLASMARLISAQGVVDQAEQMSMNLMQFMSRERAVEVLGQDGAMQLVNISPGMIAGDFYYPVHDGTLPIDKVAMLEVWKEIFMAVLKDPQLRMSFDVVRLFVYIAELGGAKNLDQFKIQALPGQTIDQGLQAGNLAPLGAQPGATPQMDPNAMMASLLAGQAKMQGRPNGQGAGA